jgi:uncharacterized membrane protein YgdD (TMEM256/DUF423 family)
VFRTFLFLGALLGFAGVGLGAFGAHGLRGRLAADMFAVFQTGVQYHLVHALALVLVAALALAAERSGMPAPNSLAISGWLFFVGVLIFSGSLYVLSITGIRWLGAITPLGGVCFLIGWALLAFTAYRWR